MKLGYIRMPNPNSKGIERGAIIDQIKLADTLGLELGYLPGISPQTLVRTKKMRTKNLQIGLDATQFGDLAPRELEAAIRTANDDLSGQLFLGVETGCGHGSRQSRAQAQTFETMFSQTSRDCESFAILRYPMKPPCPKIIGLPTNGSRDEIALAAARGYLPMTPSWLSTPEVARHWPAIVEGATSSWRRALPDQWKIARSIVIHNDRSVIQEYVFGPYSPIRKHYTRLAQKGLIGMDVDRHMKRVVISGSKNEVSEQLMELQETVCEIGTLLVVDQHESDLEIARNTMVSLAETVIPLVNRSEISSAKELERT